MSEKDILYRAIFYTMQAIEKEEEINKNTIKENGRENNISKMRIKKYQDEISYMTNKVLEIEKNNQ